MQIPILNISPSYLLCDESHLLSFCSSDVFCLADHSEVKKGAIRFILEFGLAPYELADHPPLFQERVAQKCASLLQRESLLFFPSYFDALQALEHTFLKEGVRLLVDAEYPLFAKAPSCLLRDPPSLHSELSPHRRGSQLIAFEAISSVSGTLTSFEPLLNEASAYEALLLVDESHSIGIYGKEGEGLSVSYTEIEFILGSLAGICGGPGAFLACSQEWKRLIVRHASFPLRLTTPLLGALDAALDLLSVMEGERLQLQQRGRWLRAAFSQIGIETAFSTSPLLTLSFDSLQEAEQLRALLKERLILVRPPLVCGGPHPSYRIPIQITTAHTPEQLQLLVQAVDQAQADLLL